MSENSKRILNFFGLLLFVGFITFLVSQSVGLGGSGFDSALILQQFSFYLAGGLFAFFILCGFVIEFVIRKGDERYGSSILFSSPGETPAIPFFKRYSQFKILFLSVIIFSIMGILAFVTKQNTFTGIAPVQQQFTPGGELLFSSLLIAGAENLGLALVILATIIIIRSIARRKNWTSANFRIMCYIFVPLLGSIYWVINHLLHYGGSDLSLITVFGFGLFMTVLTIMTGSFIPGWIAHMSNNFFFDLQKVFTRDNAIIGTVIGIIVLIFIYFLIFRGKRVNINAEQ